MQTNNQGAYGQGNNCKVSMTGNQARTTSHDTTSTSNTLTPPSEPSPKPKKRWRKIVLVGLVVVLALLVFWPNNGGDEYPPTVDTEITAVNSSEKVNQNVNSNTEANTEDPILIELASYDWKVGYKRFFGEAISLDFYGDGSSYNCFTFEPVTCGFLAVPISLESTDGYDFEQIQWVSAFHIVDDDTWYFFEPYEYDEGLESYAIMRADDSLTIDAVTVLPVDAPNGVGGFMISANFSDTIIGFVDKASADIFADSLVLESTTSSSNKNKDDREDIMQRINDVIDFCGDTNNVEKPGKNSEVFPEFKTKYVKSGKGHSIYSFWDSEGHNKRPHYVMEGTEVTVMAEYDGMSFCLYKNGSGENKVGWLGSEWLVDKY